MIMKYDVESLNLLWKLNKEESLNIPKNINNSPYGFFGLFINKEYLLKIEKNSNY